MFQKMSIALFLVSYSLQNLVTSHSEMWGLCPLLNLRWDFWLLWLANRIWQKWCHEIATAPRSLKRYSSAFLSGLLTLLLSKPSMIPRAWEKALSFMNGCCSVRDELGYLLLPQNMQGKGKKTTKYALSKKYEKQPKLKLFNLAWWSLLSFYFHLLTQQYIQGANLKTRALQKNVKMCSNTVLWNNLDTVPPWITPHCENARRTSSTPFWSETSCSISLMVVLGQIFIWWHAALSSTVVLKEWPMD